MAETKVPQHMIERELYSAGLSGNFSTSSTSAVDVTGLSQSVTLKKTSNVRITLTTRLQNNTDTSFFNLFIKRDSTTIRTVSFVPSASGTGHEFILVFFDEDLAAGTYTFKVQIAAQSGDTVQMNNIEGNEFVIEVFPA